MKELVKQQTKQLQEEEEERTRKPKDKALAKLDELNKHTQVVDGPNKKGNATRFALQNKTQESEPSESENLAGKSGASMMCSANSQMSVNSTNKVGTSSIFSVEESSEKLNARKEYVPNQSETLHQDEATSTLQVQNNIATKQRRVGYKQKQNLPSNEKLISVTPTTSKVESGPAIDVAMSPGIATNKSFAAAGGLTTVVETHANQKKKNNKNGKNKHKVEESSASVASLPLAIPKEANLFGSSVESDHPKASNFDLNQDSVQHAPNQHSERSRNSINEEFHGRVSSQWKSQSSRRMPRNMQATRPAEKSHGNDAVVWAPVKPQNKMEVADESAEKSKSETDNSVRGDQQVHNNMKNKRAEMERYIPKPAVKEMVQQGSVPPVASSVNEGAAYEFVAKVASASQGLQISQHPSSSVVKVASGVESKNGNGRPTKGGKTHGSWRQRGSTESINVHDTEEGLHSDPSNGQNLQKSTERQQAQKSDMSSGKGQSKHVNDPVDHDSSHQLNNQDWAAQPSAPDVKEHQAVTGRGRRGPFRGHKGMGMNHDIDHKKHVWGAEKSELQISSSEHGQPDVGAAFKENRSVGERLTAHWQPKSQASGSQRGSRPYHHDVGSEANSIKKDFTHGNISGMENETHAARPHHDQSVSEKGKAGEATSVVNQDAKVERRNATSKGRSHSPSQVNVGSVEPPLTSSDFRPEQHSSSGFRRNGNQNHFGRGHESRGDWKSSGQDNRHYNQPPERQGHNLQYEYHPVGSHDNSKSYISERPKDSNYNGGRYRDRGQSHSRRGGGNFYGRQGGSFD